jgi:tRNA/rRNA methyltransferase
LTGKPVIVLVRPQLGANIGKAARAMLNFGLTEMRLVAPRDGWPNPSAGPAASGADLVLESAQLFDTVQEAVADCSTIYASTVRRRDLVLPVLTPEEMARNIAADAGRTAILFGPERSRTASLEQPPAKEMEAAAPHGELEGLINQLNQELETKGYFFPPERAEATRNTLRTILTKPRWASPEVKAMRGVIRALVRPPRIR